MTAHPDSALYPDLYKPSKGYVFIVTYGRSGSTLTQSLLNAIPGYCLRGENANATARIAQLIDQLDKEKNFTMRRDRVAAHRAGTSRRGLDTIGTPADPWFGAELLDIDRFGRGLLDTFVREMLHLPDGVRVGGFKEIRYLGNHGFLKTHLKILQHFFPAAKLILQTRDHAAVANSGWWRERDPALLIHQLTLMDKELHSYRASHDNCFHLDYATYSQGAEALKPLFAFLDEPFDHDSVQAVLDRPLTHCKAPPP